MKVQFELESVPEILREPLARWWERAGAQADLLNSYAALPDGLRAEMPRVAAGSEFVASVLIQDPQALEWFGRNEAPSAARIAGAEYETRAASASTMAEAQRILREWRRRELLRIAWRDIAGRAAVTET
jgi:glutamate-ammonia-ligase adenylyltransferase